LVGRSRTLAGLAGLDGSKIEANVQGESLAPVFDAPTAPPAALASKPAYSQIGRCNCGIYQTRDVSPTTASSGNVFGLAEAPRARRKHLQALP